MSVITVTRLGKAYKQYPTRWSRLAEWVFPFSGLRHELKWVLQDINFQVEPGEAVGIIGINGAGKSTLLKMITGTTQPTTGSVEISGRVAALLELGMGFHPDFTGRQNVIMSGQLLGLAVEEIVRLMPEIESFAEIGDYIDQPVRVYSSGMQVRLAFSVATAVRPDVLIVDEALTVGDMAFQRKCYARIETFQGLGTTLLFVSHDTEIIKKICSRALLLSAGQMQAFGPAKQVCEEYERLLFGTPKGKNKLGKQDSDAAGTFDSSLNAFGVVYGNGIATIDEAWIESDSGQKINVLESGCPFVWKYRVRFNESAAGVIFAMMVKTLEGVAIYAVDSKHLEVAPQNYQSGDMLVVTFRLDNSLAPGIYFLNCGVRVSAMGESLFLCRHVDAAILKITDRSPSTIVAGLTDLKAQLSVGMDL